MDTDVHECKKSIAEVVTIIRAAAKMLSPFIPIAAARVQGWLLTDTLPEIDVLFKRLDIKEVKEKFARYWK